MDTRRLSRDFRRVMRLQFDAQVSPDPASKGAADVAAPGFQAGRETR